jgi:hypothetical protein
MNNSESDFLQMTAFLVSLFEEHTAAWTSKSPIEDVYQNLKVMYDKVPALLSLQDLSVAGFTEQKNNARNLLLKDLNKFCNGIAYHGAEHNQPEIAKRFSISPTEIEKKGDKELWGFAEGVLAAVAGMSTSSKDAVGLTAAAITTFTAHYTAFKSLVGNPNHKIQEAERGTIQLRVLIKDMRELLEAKLDRAVKMIEAEEPDFAIEYWGVREIVDTGSTTRALTATITATGSNAPIAGASATINPGNISKLSGASGIFYLQSLPPGSYTMLVSRSGYDSKTVNFTIVANEHTQLTVQLVSNGATENPPPGGGA